MFELKHDGFRAMAYVAAGKCELISRRRNDKSFVELEEEIGERLRVKSAVLDGEIVCLDSGGAASLRNCSTGVGTRAIKLSICSG